MFGLDTETIASGGLLLISFIVFAESGLLIGFFLPGDTLLIAAGILAAQGNLPIALTIVSIAVAAVVGDNVGYTIGWLTGPKLFHKKDGILFRHEYVEQAQAFYDKHGGKTIAFARFVPIIRTFAPLVAGIGKMPRAKFLAFDIPGAFFWSASVTLLGYWLGSKIPNLGHYLEFIVIGVMVLSVGQALFHILKDPKSRRLIVAKFKNLFRARKSKSD
jgi:membrane-associated protein